MRLDQYLAQTYPELSRHKLARAIKAGLVTINGHSADPDTAVAATDQISFDPTPLAPQPDLPEKIELKIVFENDDFLIVDKPVGLVVHPGVGHASGTLLNALLYHHDERGLDRAGIVHRLDKDTSGLMVVAKTASTQKKLVNLFKARQVHKQYLGLVKGLMPEPAGELSSPIGRDPKHPLKFAVTKSGKEAITRYFVEGELPHHTLLRLLPLTGRTHQLRVHLAGSHHPIYGDTLYGGEHSPRLFLHATKLAFRLNDKEWSFESPLPPELEGVLKQLA